jgi:hypothetical protein
VAAWHEEPINKRHNREALDCGEEALNEFTALSRHHHFRISAFFAVETHGREHKSRP